MLALRNMDPCRRGPAADSLVANPSAAIASDNLFTSGLVCESGKAKNGTIMPP